MRRVKQIITVTVGLAIVLIIGLFIVVSTIDANKYRPQIIEALNKQTGRMVKLDGPISLSPSFHGIILGIQDAAISNPSWASRPQMAGIGKFELGLSLLPLLSHQIVITQLKIANADIQLETSASGQQNWDMQPVGASKAVPAAAAKTTEKSSDQSVSIHVDGVSVSDSQLTMRDRGGKTSVFKTKLLTFGVKGDGVALHFVGEANGADVSADVKTGMPDLFATGTYPIDADLTYGDVDVKMKGKASFAGKKADISSYEVSAGKSSLHGAFSANWGGARPSINGTLVSDHLNPVDFTPPSSGASAPGKAENTPVSSGPRRVFSDTPLPLDALKSADADLDISVAEMPVGQGEIKKVSGTVQLQAGHLALPIKLMLGDANLSGEIKLTAATPVQLSANFNAPGVHLEDLLKMAGAPAFLSGKADADMDIVSSGDSLHGLASNANGKMDLIAGQGTISTAAAGEIASGLMNIFAPKGSGNTLNCIAARFTVTGGVVKDNGILADTSATTVAGKGGFNLGQETMDLTLHAKPKSANIGGLLPPLHVGGSFLSPSFTADPSVIVQNVAGMLLNGVTTLDSGVPALATAPAGQNACVYTLDHPQAAPAATSNNNTTSKATQKINKIGGVLKGLFK